jgi:hypothetical protein
MSWWEKPGALGEILMPFVIQVRDQEILVVPLVMREFSDFIFE